ncbi:MAG: type II secretion system secretin GspD [Thermodesulfobacteriota bacterium]
MRSLVINVLILGFLLTLYVYLNTDNEKTVIKENSAQTTELETKASEKTSDNADTSYKAQEGDTLSQISERFNMSVGELQEYNGLTKDELSVGQYIDIPQKKHAGNPELVSKEDYAPYGDPNNSQTMTQSSNDNNSSSTDNSAPQENSDRQSEIEKRRQELMQQRQLLRQNRTRTQSPQSQRSTQRFNQPTSKTEEQKTEAPETGTKEEKKSEVTITNGEIVNIQSEMDIQDLIKTISEITGQNFILDESVKGKKITVVAPGGFKKENAMKLFQTILNLNGFAVVKKEGADIIVPKRDIKITSIPTDVGTKQGESSDTYITRLVQLKTVQASEVANALKPLISREGDIVVSPATNTLIVIETVDNLNRILKIIENLDKETEIEFIKLHNADAAEVAAKLVDVFGGTASTTPSTPAQQSQLQRPSSSSSSSRSRNIPGSQGKSETENISAQSTTEKSAVGFKVITDERTNSLIIIAYPGDMKKIKEVIEILDTETSEPEEGIYVIRLVNADATKIVSVLAGLFGGSGASTGGQLSTAHGTSGYGSTSPFGNTSSSSTVGASTGTSIGTTGQAIQRGTTGGSAVVAETDQLRITADPSTNSIVFIGTKRDFDTVKQVIRQLDIRKKQVYVEAAILEVALDKIRAFGTNMGFAATINGSTLTFGGTQLPGVPSLLGIAAAGASSAAATNFIGSLQGLYLGVAGSEVTLPGGITIPSYNFFFQALTSLTDVNVLSTPSIMTTDNEPAQIIVADVIPFPTGSTIGTSGVTVSTIERDPVGIRLAITPQISEGDFMKLNILTEVSAIKSQPVQGLNTAQFGIATTTRSADSSVVVKSGQTIVIGGLVQDMESNLTNRVPVLGNIPVLGNLFKFKQKQSQKINLLILITPRIVHNDYDMQRILEEKQKRNMLLQERGFNKENTK